MRRIFSGLLTGAMALAMVAGSSTKADAAFQLAICNDALCAGGNDYFVTDNATNNSLGLEGDNNDDLGRIAVDGAFGGLNFTVVGSFSLDGDQPDMDLNWLADGTGSVWLYATDTDFTTAGAFSAQFSSTLLNATATATVRGGDDNSQLNLAPTLLTLGPLTSPGGFVTGSGSTGSTSPYSLTLGVALVHTTGGRSSGDFALQVVPEPTSMALFGLGLLGFGAARRRRVV